MRRIVLLSAIVFSFGLVSCQEDVVPDASALVEGLLNYNSEVVVTEINKLTDDLDPQADVHESNLNTLMQRIEGLSVALEVTDFCYACFESLPPQSEIELNVDSLGIAVTRSVKILTPQDGKLTGLRVH